ncbi:MAG: hypothetical protein AAF703_15720 [Cyanobacteria bacterium P01_D01_bin.105]
MSDEKDEKDDRLRPLPSIRNAWPSDQSYMNEPIRIFMFTESLANWRQATARQQLTKVGWTTDFQIYLPIQL